MKLETMTEGVGLAPRLRCDLTRGGLGIDVGAGLQEET